jgi:hypothetical protein
MTLGTARVACLAFALAISPAVRAQTASCSPAVKFPGIGFDVWSAGFIRVAPGSQVVLGPDEAGLGVFGAASCEHHTAYTSLWSPGGQATRTATVTAPGPGVTQVYTLTTTSGAQVKTGTVSITGVPVGSPICTLSAPKTTITVGESVTVTSSCSPPATSLFWSRYTPDTTGTASFSFQAPGGYSTLLFASNFSGSGPVPAVGFTVIPASGAIGFATRTASTSAGGLRPVGLLVRRTGADASAPAATVSYSCAAATNPSGSAFTPVITPAAAGTLSFPTPTSTATISARLPEFAPGTTSATVTCTLSNPQPASIALDAPTHIITVTAPVFPMTVTTSVTPTTSSASATLQFRPQDVGTNGSVYVFAMAPASIVHAAADMQKDARVAWTAKGSEKDSVACVLAQLNAAGQLQAVSVSSIQAYVTGVLSGQGQAVTVLNGVPTVNIAGATFYVGYGPSASTMINSGVNRSVAAIPGSASCAPQPPQTGWWWNTAEGGRGYSIETSGNVIFFASYLYDPGGRATWTIAAGNTSLDGSLFAGRLEGYAGGQSLSGGYQAHGPVSYLGDVTLAFSDTSHGTLVWPGRTIAIERFDIIPNGLGTTPLANQPENGWWWNPSEDGRGFFLEWQGNTLFMAGYMYDANGDPLWYYTSAPATSLQSYSSKWLQLGNGPTLSGPYRQPETISSNVAPVTIQFQGPDVGIMTLPGNRTTRIERYRF